MKQITVKELKELCACVSNNDLANTISIWLFELSRTSSFNSELRNLFEIRANDIYLRLKEIGYYD